MLVHIALGGVLSLLGYAPSIAYDPNPLLVMAESSTIQSLSINGSMYKVTAPVSRAVAIDVLASEGRLCWSDVRSKTISTSYINGSDSKTIVRKLSVPDGLAIDWIGRLVYFTDAGLNVIGVTDLEGRHTVMVVRENLDKPRAIAVDPAGGYMYWTDWGTTPKIERAFMSGRRRETLIDSEVKWPNGLTLDLIQRRLYWADAAFDRIETSRLDGKSRQVVMKASHNIHPFGLALQDSDIYWSDWSDSSLYRTSIKSGVTTLVSNLNSRPFGIAAYNSSRQTGTNACSNGNGGCEQLCLAEPGSAVCACSSGLLQADNKTCNTPGRYLLVADMDTIRGLANVEGKDTTVDAIQPIQTHRRAVAVEFHSKTGRIFYADVVTKAVIQVAADSSQKIVLSGLSVIEGIGFDWTTDNLYFVDSGHNVIGVVAVDRPLNKVLIRSGLDRPRGIVLDPVEGMMYWTDWGSKPKIEGADMSGASRRTLVDTGLGWPNGITLDQENQALYWVDALRDRVETCKTDGSAHFVLLDTSSVHPFGVAFSSNRLFWTDWRLNSIVCFDITSRNYTAMAVPFPPMTKPSGIVLHDPLLRNGTSSCSVNNGNCIQLCLPRPSGRSCACTASRPGDCLPRFLSNVTELEVREGRNAIIPCVVADVASSGLPLVRVDWLRNRQNVILSVTGRALDNGNFPFVINRVTLADVARYSCRVTNGYGTVSTTVSLVVILDSRLPTSFSLTTTTHMGRETSRTTPSPHGSVIASVSTQSSLTSTQAVMSPRATVATVISDWTSHRTSVPTTGIMHTPRQGTGASMKLTPIRKVGSSVIPTTSYGTTKASPDVVETRYDTTMAKTRSSAPPSSREQTDSAPVTSTSMSDVVPTELVSSVSSLVESRATVTPSVLTSSVSVLDPPDAGNNRSSGKSPGLTFGLITVGCFIAVLLVIIGIAMWCQMVRRKTRVPPAPRRVCEEPFENPIYPPSGNVSPFPSSPQRNIYAEADQDPVYAEIGSSPKLVFEGNHPTGHEYQTIYGEKSVGIGTSDVDGIPELPTETAGYVKMSLCEAKGGSTT